MLRLGNLCLLARAVGFLHLRMRNVEDNYAPYVVRTGFVQASTRLGQVLDVSC